MIIFLPSNKKNKQSQRSCNTILKQNIINISVMHIQCVDFCGLKKNQNRMSSSNVKNAQL